MNDPLSLLPFALAGGGGSINGMPAEQPVAAGVALLQRCAPLVRALAGRRGALLLPGGPAFLTALAATEGRGAVLVDPLAAAPEIAHQLGDADVGAVFTLAALADRLPAGVLRVELDGAPRSARVIHDGQTRVVDLGSHVGFRLEGEQGVDGRDEEAAVVYTSAMAGTPLGAILTHANLLAGARAAIGAAGLTAADRVLAPLPWSRLLGLVVGGAAPLLAGAAVLAPARVTPPALLQSLEDDGVTVVVGSPDCYRGLLAALERRDAPLRAPTLRLSICGGAPLDPALQERWAHATGVELRQGYGLTEGGALCLFNQVDQPNHRGTLGTPVPGAEVVLQDPRSGAVCVDGQEGEICVRGPAVSAAYVGGAGGGLASRAGWLLTGDLGVRRADGYISFRGVVKRRFARDGRGLYPAELELAARRLEGVREARVTGTPGVGQEHEIRLEATGPVTEAAVRGWLQSQLAAYKQPTEVVVRAD